MNPCLLCGAKEYITKHHTKSIWIYMGKPIPVEYDFDYCSACNQKTITSKNLHIELNNKYNELYKVKNKTNTIQYTSFKKVEKEEKNGFYGKIKYGKNKC